MIPSTIQRLECGKERKGWWWWGGGIDECEDLWDVFSYVGISANVKQAPENIRMLRPSFTELGRRPTERRSFNIGILLSFFYILLLLVVNQSRIRCWWKEKRNRHPSSECGSFNMVAILKMKRREFIRFYAVFLRFSRVNKISGKCRASRPDQRMKTV